MTDADQTVPPEPAVMAAVDSALPPLATAVAAAQEELSRLVSSLTSSLRAVAEAPEPPVTTPPGGATGDKSAPPPAGSIASDIPARLAALRAATGVALAADAARRAAREADEAAVDDNAAALLRAQRDALRAEARAGNERLKRLIDQLRTLHRDLGVICDAPPTEAAATATPAPTTAAAVAPDAMDTMDFLPSTAPVEVATVE